MEEDSSSPGIVLTNIGKNRRRQRLTVLIVCVLIATFLWFLRAFENDYSTWIDHPVNYINLPDKMITLDPLPNKVRLEVKGMGFSILRHNWNFSKTPLIIDFKKIHAPSIRRKKGFIEFLPMNQFIADFSSQLKGINVQSILPDTIRFQFAYKITRTIIVKPAFVYDSGMSEIADSLVIVTPAIIEVEGPDLILDTLQNIRTLPIKFNRQGEASNKSIGLEEIHRMVKMNPTKVNVAIDKTIE
jgi:hypothetical protein